MVRCKAPENEQPERTSGVREDCEFAGNEADDRFSTAPTMPSVYLKIVGHVQGVFFRANTQKEAQKLGLTGWVRNTSDGNVEAQAFGSKEKLDSFVAWCHKGPPHARVDLVEETWGNEASKSEGFKIKY